MICGFFPLMKLTGNSCLTVSWLSDKICLPVTQSVVHDHNNAKVKSQGSSFTQTFPNIVFNKFTVQYNDCIKTLIQIPTLPHKQQQITFT